MAAGAVALAALAVVGGLWLTRGAWGAGRYSVEGTWSVRALNWVDGSSLLTPSTQGVVTMTFSRGLMTGETGCNSVWSDYTQSGSDGQDLKFSPQNVGGTSVACAGEPQLTQRLLAVRHVTGTADVRFLQDENGTMVAELHLLP